MKENNNVQKERLDWFHAKTTSQVDKDINAFFVKMKKGIGLFVDLYDDKLSDIEMLRKYSEMWSKLSMQEQFDYIQIADFFVRDNQNRCTRIFKQVSKLILSIDYFIRKGEFDPSYFEKKDDESAVLDDINARNINHYNKNEIGFDKLVLETLKNEAIILHSKIKIERENGNYGTYKNLIQAYKEILELFNTQWDRMWNND